MLVLPTDEADLRVGQGHPDCRVRDQRRGRALELLKGTSRNQEVVRAADALDFGDVTHRETVGVGCDQAKSAVVGREQHAGQ